MTQFLFLSSMVVTEKYHPGVELYKCCLRTNTYFQVIKESSFFSYCSIIPNSQKALGFQEHSHDCLPSNRGYILFSCDGDRTFYNRKIHSLLDFPPVLFVGGESLDMTLFAHFLTLNSPENLLQ
uniref:Uncharacterized protein n=1 Tax=Pipistrellus kuhlii TaxID=59472 RepID=A0A7J7VV43_PIPKU|nr:hypothetical protein mPipKuh1_008273 [Pipistrellus kuhlii]